MTNTQKTHTVHHHKKFQDMGTLAEKFLMEIADLAADGDMHHAPEEYTGY